MTTIIRFVYFREVVKRPLSKKCEWSRATTLVFCSLLLLSAQKPLWGMYHKDLVFVKEAKVSRREAGERRPLRAGTLV